MHQIRRKTRYLDRLCTFNFDIATKFLARTLTIIEGEKYQETDLELENTHLNVALFVATKVPISTTDYEDLCLITTKRNTKIVSDMYENDELEDSADVHCALEDSDGKYLLLESDDTYKLFDAYEQEATEELTEKYSYLSQVIYGLIDFRLANPDITEERLIEIFLQNMPNNYAQLISVIRGRRK